VRDQDAAEDIVQNVFTNALAALPRFEVRPGQTVRAWLFRIARNAIISRFRADQQHELMAPVELDASRESPVDVGWLESLHWLTDYEVALFVDRLPLAQRQTLLLRYMLDLPTEQIAAVLDRTPLAIRLLEHRALKTLSARLHEIGRTAPNGSEQVRQPMRVRLKHAPVLRERRFALASFSGRLGSRPGWGRFG
jgi:RNA polymerase sigma-70 factor (ECF subfamily)